MEQVNALSLPLLAVMSLVGIPLLLRRAGYPWGKTVLGTATGLVVLMGCWNVISMTQQRLGLAALPLGWLMPLAAVFAAWHWRNRL